MTPRLFVALQKQHAQQERERYKMLAVMRQDVINYSFCRPKEPVRLEDLLPAEEKERAPRQRRRLSAKRRAEIAESWRKALDGGSFGPVAR